MIKANKEVKAGDLLEMWITASQKTSIIIEIIDAEGEEIEKITCVTTKEFICQPFWNIPKNIIPGTYTIKAYDTTASTETTFEIITK